MKKRVALVVLVALGLIGLLFTRTTTTAQAVEPFSEQELKLLLARGSAKVRLRMSDGSRVYLGSASHDGRQVGNTNAENDVIVVPPGNVTVSTLTLSGHRREKKLTVIAGEEHEVVFEP